MRQIYKQHYRGESDSGRRQRREEEFAMAAKELSRQQAVGIASNLMLRSLTAEVVESLDDLDANLEANERELEALGVNTAEDIEPLPPEPDDYEFDY